jgi:membrane protein DedA with SNARE-associated domain
MEFLSYLVSLFSVSSPTYAYAAVFGMLLICGFGVPIPEDITLVAGGVISGLGYAELDMMILVGMLGVMVGDSIMFCTGYFMGDKVRKFKWIAFLLNEKRYQQVQAQFAKRGNFVLFFARFLPGLRSPIFLTAGMTRQVSYWRFFMMDGFAALISVPVWIWLGHYFARERETLLMWISNGQRFVLISLALIIAGVALWYFRKKRLKNTPEQ